MKPLKLLFIRHAESIGNQQGRMLGHTDDDLSEPGRMQAAQLAQQLWNESWQPSHFYSSPLRRAADTAAILHDRFPDAPIRYSDDLREFQNGILQGLTWTEAQDRYPALCQALETSLDWIPIPGAESLQAGRDRADRFIAHLLHQHANGDRVCIITHSWILQQLVAGLLGSERVWGFAVSHTARFEFWIDRSRWQRSDPPDASQSDQKRLNTELWQIRRFNDDRHLWITARGNWAE